MVTKYKLVNWAFDRALWMAAISLCLESIDIKELALMLDMSPSGIRNWRDGNFAPGFEHPSMSSFLKVANLLDLDVREFFVLEDKS